MESDNFNSKKLLDNFYNVEDYTNYKVLFCYNLVFSSRVKTNIFFYIFLALFVIFLGSMIGNLIKALKEINKIIFNIFQQKYMVEFMKNIIKNHKNDIGGRERKIKINNKSRKEFPFSSLETNKISLKTKKNRNSVIVNTKLNINNDKKNEKNNKINKNEKKKKLKDKNHTKNQKENSLSKKSLPIL